MHFGFEVDCVRLGIHVRNLLVMRLFHLGHPRAEWRSDADDLLKQWCSDTAELGQQRRRDAVDLG